MGKWRVLRGKTNCFATAESSGAGASCVTELLLQPHKAALSAVIIQIRFILSGFHTSCKTSAASGFVTVFFTQQHLVFTGCSAVGVAGQVTTHHADGVDLGHIFGHGEQLGHGAKGFTEVVHVETGHNDPAAALGQLLHHAHQFIVKELGFINTHNFHLAGVEQDVGGMLHGCAMNAVRIVRNNGGFVVTRIEQGLEDFGFLVGKLRTPQSADEFFRFPREHGATNHFYPAMGMALQTGFGKHVFLDSYRRPYLRVNAQK